MFDCYGLLVCEWWLYSLFGVIVVYVFVFTKFAVTLIVLVIGIVFILLCLSTFA